MSAHQAWLERPYEEAAELSEADERAQEAGYDNAEEWWEAMEADAADRKFEEMRDRRMFGEEW